MLFKVSNSKRAMMYVLHVTKLTCNLFSMKAAAKRGNTVKYSQSHAELDQRSQRKSIRNGHSSMKAVVYYLECKSVIDKESASVVSEEVSEVDLRH